MMSVVPVSLVKPRIVISPIRCRATCSMKVKDPPIFNTTPVTHDLYGEDNTADEPQLATIA
jgi:hypothetical protein